MVAGAPRHALLAGGLVLGGATLGMLAGIEPFATWYYLFAWYPLLLMIDAAVALKDGRFHFLARPAFLVSLLVWSVPFWLFFELLNFRLENWYYVHVPPDRAVRWAAIILSFATVLPAIFGAERLLAVWGMGSDAEDRTPLVRLSPSRLAGLQAVGLVMLVLPLFWPRVFFPLVWGGVTLLADPFVYRRDRARSLLGDLERGRTDRILRLLIGGMAIGFLWELFNAAARAGWIYTVPGLEHLKLFEMPLLGFLGFPVFALEAFAAYQALVVTGLAVSAGEPPGRGWRAPARLAAAVGAAVFSGLVLLGMERATINGTPLAIAPGDAILVGRFPAFRSPSPDDPDPDGGDLGRRAGRAAGRRSVLPPAGGRLPRSLVAAGARTGLPAGLPLRLEGSGDGAGRWNGHPHPGPDRDDP